MKLKKGDEVKVVVGKDKGKTGKIDKVFSKMNAVLILGINTYKRHKKARTGSEKSEIVTIVKPLPVTNVMLVCPKCHTPTRVGYTMDGEDKVRVCRKCEQRI